MGTSSLEHSRVLPVVACESQLEECRLQPDETAQGSDGHVRGGRKERGLCKEGWDPPEDRESAGPEAGRGNT